MLLTYLLRIFMSVASVSYGSKSLGLELFKALSVYSK
ncbi:hypothetical protein J2X77_003545 [Sphingobacterium sp. 2149]|nr:hypothetical protein [Sphingobacterium sp. 2149]